MAIIQGGGGYLGEILTTDSNKAKNLETQRDQRTLLYVEEVEETDASLWAKAVDGDPECFGTIFDRHARRIYSHCFRKTADASMAEELVSVVFLEAWRRRADIAIEQDSALPWLLGVSTNVCRNALRSLHRYRAALSRIPPPAENDFDIEDAVARIDAEVQMREVLSQVKQLSQDEQDVVALCAWQQLSYQDAAIALGVPIGTVQSRLARARARLRSIRKSNENSEHVVRDGHIYNERQVTLRRKGEQ